MIVYLYILVYAIIFAIFTYEAGWIKWPFFKWFEHAWNRGSWFWLCLFGGYLVAIPILILF